MKISKVLKKQKSQAAVLLILVIELLFPSHVGAVSIEQNSKILPNLVIKSADEPNSQEVSGTIFLAVPRREYKTINTYNIPVTAYSSTTDQTDSTPCITANGFDLCAHNQEDVIAANFLPFGTKVRMPELFGNRIFTVQDRMNSRYYHRADVWMKERSEAVKFGLNYTTIEVVE